MTNRLEEIKVRWGMKNFGVVTSEWIHRYSPTAATDMEWLISEVEQLRAENDRLTKFCKEWIENEEQFQQEPESYKDEHHRLQEENKRLEKENMRLESEKMSETPSATDLIEHYAKDLLRIKEFSDRDK